MRKAVIIGIDYYTHGNSLYGCANDAASVSNILDRHDDTEKKNNFSCLQLVAKDSETAVTRRRLKNAAIDVFDGDSEIALFYFAGHGHKDIAGGYLLGSDSTAGDDGFPIPELVSIANQSRAQSTIVILDCCHSGIAASAPNSNGVAQLSDGMTILTASTDEQYATEDSGSGVFTTLLIDALNGAAANLVGDVTPASIYAHIDQSLGPWKQRPVFKTNVSRFVSVRRVTPPISMQLLLRLSEFFPSQDYVFPLDSSYEPESDAPDTSKTEVFAILQQYNRVNLVVPVDAPHMYHAAIQNKWCKLTVLGRHYQQLIVNGRI